MSRARPNESPVGVICDLDGTLAHTAPSIHRAGELMLKELELPLVSIGESMRFIGDGLDRYVKRMLTGQLWREPDQELFARGLELMRRHYAANLTRGSTLFPGVKRTLGKLAGMGCSLACVTNKPEQSARDVLEHFDIARHFSVLVGGDTLDEKKPHPKPVLHSLERMGVGNENSLFVGDGSADFKACESAGVYFVAVEYGYNRYPVGSEHFRPSRTIKRFSDVLSIVAGMEMKPQASHG